MTWNRGGEAVKVYKVPGTMEGTNWFNISDWQTGSGGEWRHWTANNGVFSDLVGSASTCELGTISSQTPRITLSPNPFTDKIMIDGTQTGKLTIFDSVGKEIFSSEIQDGEIPTTTLTSGLYFVKIQIGHESFVRKMVKR